MERYFFIRRAHFLGIVLICSVAIHADDTMGEDECPVIMPNFDDMVLLTREERIQLMDQALQDALSQVQDCQQQSTEMQNQSGGGGGGSSSSGNSNGAGTNQSGENTSDGETQNQQTATPSGNLSGTETSQPTNTQPAQTPMPSNELSGNEKLKARPANYLTGSLSLRMIEKHWKMANYLKIYHRRIMMI